MLNINLIKTSPKEVAKALSKKGYNISFDELIEKDKLRRSLLQEVENLKALRNKVSAEIPKLKKEGKPVEDIFEKMRVTNEKISELDNEVSAVDNYISSFLSELPNIPDEDLASGGKENNEVIKVFGEKPNFNFTPKHHVDLCTSLKMIDYERGAKIAGGGFWAYRGIGARLEWALLNYFIDTHLADNYEFILPPHMLNYSCGYGAGQFPKFAEDVFWLEGDEDIKKNRFMLPTAETALVNLYSGEILDEKQLPIKLFAYTPCYRKEAGSYGSEERGMIRGHQFNKVEMVQIAHPDQSAEGFDELVNKAAKLIDGLGLHFRISKLAAGDCSASMARTYDIEVWIPSMGIYKEVSSVSNANDYQARRNNTRYKDQKTGKNNFVHTLNGSGLATSRIIPAIVEQLQNEDGSVTIPLVLRKYLGGMDKILP